jgi:hypothetical protein
VTPPVVVEHDGMLVVRDDLFAGSTKARFIPALFDGAQEVVYASPQEGGAQTALATVARALGKRATIFVAKRTIRTRACAWRRRSAPASLRYRRAIYQPSKRVRANTASDQARGWRPSAWTCPAQATPSRRRRA